MIGIFVNLWNRISGSVSYLLDEFSGAAAAFSLRKLSTTYGGSAIRVRRASDNTEQDIGFIGQDLDEPSLMNFVGYQNLFQRSEEFDNGYWGKFDASISPNTTTAPNGTPTADTLIENTANTFHQLGVGSGVTTISGQTYTFSFYAKQASGTRYLAIAPVGTGTNTQRAVFDLVNGVFLGNATVGAGSGQVFDSSNTSIQSVGNGWYRCSATVTVTGTLFYPTFTLMNGFLNNTSTGLSYTGDGTSGVFIWGAQLNTGTSAQPYQVTTSAARSGDGFVTKWYDQSGFLRDASQSTAANQPRIVGGGVIERENGKAAIRFDGVDDHFVGTDVALTVWSLFSTASGYLPNPDSIHTIYARGSSSNNSRDAFLYLNSGNSVDAQRSNGSLFPTSTARVNIARYTLASGVFTGSVITAFGNSVSGEPVSTSIAGSSTPVTLIGAMRQLTGTIDYYMAGDIGEIIVYDSNRTSTRADIERNLGSYYQTHWTGASSGLLDQFGGAAAAYSLRNLSSQYRGPLIRVRRSSDNAETDIGGTYNGDLDVASLVSFTGGQNLVLESEDFLSASWTKTNSSVTRNVTIAPDGSLTADKLNETAVNNQHWVGQSYNIVTSSIFTVSFYLKAAERTFVNVGIFNNIAPFDYFGATFNLSNGTVFSTIVSGTSVLLGSSMTPVGNGWYRCSVTGTTNKTGTHVAQCGLTLGGTSISYLGVDGSGVYIWGAQLNTGILQPYIPTTTTAVNGANAFVTRWYDQSGQARDAIQATAANQPRIVNAGGVESEGNRPAVFWTDGSGMRLTASFPAIPSPQSFFVVNRIGATSGVLGAVLFDSYNNIQNIYSFTGTSETPNNTFLYGGGAVIYGPANPIPVQNLTNVIHDATSNVYNNELLTATGNAGTNSLSGLSIGNIRGNPSPITPNYDWFGDIQEFLVYPSNLAARTLVNSNINSYYQIYWQGNGTALLDNFSGASAAYSLRNLSSAYTGPLIRVRRSSDNVERDIFGTFGGDLDIASLVAFVGANSAFVTTWYDQSGSARHAVQATAGNQPRIVNAGVVDRENGKPALFFDGTNDSFNVPNGLSMLQNVGFANSFAVVTNNAAASGNKSIIFVATSLSNSRFYPYFSSTTFSTAGRRLDADSFASVAGVVTRNVQALFYSAVQYATSDAFQYVNGLLDGSNTSFQTDGNTSNTASTSVTIGAAVGGSVDFFNGDMQEVVLYNTNQLPSRIPIEFNINNYYKIY